MAEITENAAIVSRINKLLALADKGRGSTEAEATAAAIKVQELLQQYGLTLAEVENAGGKADDGGRENATLDKFNFALYAWDVALMNVIAETNFCIHRVRTVFNEEKKTQSKRHSLVGRALNVRACFQVYEYLHQAMRRSAEDEGISQKGGITKEWHQFYTGCSERLASRLRTAAEKARRESERKAAEAAKASGGGRALVLADVYGTERDLNNDHLNGYAPGTTAQRRREAEQKYEASVKRQAELVEQGVDANEAWYLANGWGAEAAKDASEQLKADNQRRSRRRGSGRGYRGGSWTKADQRRHEITNSDAYRSGAKAADSISLSPQVKQTKQIEE